MTRFAIEGGLSLSVSVRVGATAEPEAGLPAIDVSAVPGARVVLRRGFRGPDEGEVVRAACVAAPSDRWAPGLEELVLGRATGLAITSLGANVARWEPQAIEGNGDRFEQRIVGRNEGREVALVTHTLAFFGEAHEVVVCSVATVSPRGLAGDVVAAPLEGRLEGRLVSAPPPSMIVRTALLAAERPYEALALVAAVGLLVAVAIVWRRPKVPLRRSG